MLHSSSMLHLTSHYILPHTAYIVFWILHDIQRAILFIVASVPPRHIILHCVLFSHSAEKSQKNHIIKQVTLHEYAMKCLTLLKFFRALDCMWGPLICYPPYCLSEQLKTTNEMPATCTDLNNDAKTLSGVVKLEPNIDALGRSAGGVLLKMTGLI